MPDPDTEFVAQMRARHKIIGPMVVNQVPPRDDSRRTGEGANLTVSATFIESSTYEGGAGYHYRFLPRLDCRAKRPLPLAIEAP